MVDTSSGRHHHLATPTHGETRHFVSQFHSDRVMEVVTVAVFLSFIAEDRTVI